MPHKILTIAGSDTLAGGGLQADLATFSNYNFFGLSVTTSIVTVTSDDFQIFPLDLAVIAAQLESALALDDIVAVKVGLLPTPDIVRLVAQYLRDVNIPIIVDTVMVFKETTQVETKDIVACLIDQLVPLATVVTPNLREAEILTGPTITSRADMVQASQRLVALGAQNVLLKGGTLLAGDEAVDVLYDGTTATFLTQAKIPEAKMYHNGAGCTLSASLAANLGQTADVLAAAQDAKEFVWYGIKYGVDLNHTFDVGNVWQGARRAEK